ncbi:MAG: UDP-N-acetylmuramoyl-tripeptide--D-alanyl-D-alanine ligase [Actinomycetes bacterium]
MIEMSLREVAAATRGRLCGGASDSALVTGHVTADSRHVMAGDLFVALAGTQVDGHDFAGSATSGGAVAVLSDRELSVPCIVVSDVLAALGLLARAVLDRLPDVKVIGITGSSGKTSTKDLLAQVVGQIGVTIAPPGSFNNELGLPLTVLRADETTRFLVLEMGARGLGHIAYLCAVAPPMIGVELLVGSAHVGEFGSREAIARAKSELVVAIPDDGTAVLNVDDDLVKSMASLTHAHVITFGRSPDADVRAVDVTTDSSGRARFTVRTPQGEAPVALKLVGEHHVTNALAAAAVAISLDMPVNAVAEALSSAVALSRWRMEVTTRPDGVVVVNDAYNASPESVRAALKTLAQMRGTGKTWAVLGEMRELGPETVSEHDAIGRLVVRLDISHLVVVGENAKPIHLAAQMEGSWADESVFVPDADSAVEVLRRGIRPGDVVLVKAARAVGLERVAEALLDEGSAA